ncbi:hypothetical protein ABZX75_33220 [Streptomyces sp. NPDC003038]|uniref:hypothetical protein n=1 Tax=unclassified Streptomyces TaxID=2593676 RepID=UPI0033A6DBB9
MPASPDWWNAFTTHLQTHRHTFYAADAITHTARLILDAGSTDPATLLSSAHQTTPWLVRPSPTSSGPTTSTTPPERLRLRGPLL